MFVHVYFRNGSTYCEFEVEMTGNFNYTGAAEDIFKSLDGATVDNENVNYTYSSIQSSFNFGKRIYMSQLLYLMWTNVFPLLRASHWSFRIFGKRLVILPSAIQFVNQQLH